MRKRSVAVTVALAALVVQPLAGQDRLPLPLAPVTGTGQPVWPAYEGWYDAGDGTYVIYFGYHNRNTDQTLDIPLGPSNFVEPAQYDGDQPTHFETRRQWGVFGIRVPADFPTDQRIYWTLVQGGQTYRVPGHLQADYKTDALGGSASGNAPPVIALGAVEGRGPWGPTLPRVLEVRVGQPLSLTTGVTDPPTAEQAAAGGGARVPQVTLTWFKHQGPGEVAFSDDSERVPATGGTFATQATFDAPGEYVLRVQAADGGMATAGHSQCCWSNGFVNITVTR
jgi:hypothetical protein